MLGHECSGRIIEVGEACSAQYAVGERITFWCKMQGAFGEYSVISPDQFAIVKIDDGISPEEGAVMELMAGTMRVVFSSGLRLADKVAVFGLGPAGQLIAQEVRNMGAREIVGIDPEKTRRELALELGIDRVLDPLHDDCGAESNAFDLAFDSMGDNDGGDRLAIEMLRPEGTLAIFSHAIRDASLSLREVSLKDCRIIGISDKADIEKTQELLTLGRDWVYNGRINVKKLVSHTIRLDELEGYMKMLHDDKSAFMKIVVKY